LSQIICFLGPDGSPRWSHQPRGRKQSSSPPRADALVCAATALAVLTACGCSGDDSAAPGSDGKPVSITFWGCAKGDAFDRYEFRGKEKLFGLVLMGVLVPTTALALPMYLLASRTGLVNTYWSVLIPVLVNPFGVCLARVFSTGYIPNEALEAARIDGAGELRVFWSIGLRMVMPGFVTVFLFQFTAIWNNFFLPLVMLSDRKLFPLSLGLHSWNTNTRGEPSFYPLVVTGSLLAVTP
jgi:ABC-type glycerol-3-phosphate transport system permease component